ncbi:MAG TPA: c-type cytochrome domain-containing protein [Gemmata sp.]|nr:c-type cytochrome domain-containing protein [Gemmata sp.]
MRGFIALACLGPAIISAMILDTASTQDVAKRAPSTSREKADRAIHARAILRKYCFDCHGGNESKGTIRVMDHPKLLSRGPNPVPFVLPGEPAKSQIFQFIQDGSMPPGGKQRPSPAEIAVLQKWIEDGATRFPASFDEDATLRLLLDDAAAHPEDAPFIRYLSLAHLIRDDAGIPDLGKAERDLFATLAECGIRKMPTPVDPAGTLYRLDTRQAGWASRDLFLKTGGGAEGTYPLSPYDLVLMEYPHAAALPAEHPIAKELETYLRSARLSQPIPFVRADWLTAMLKKESPLAKELKSLGELHAAISKEGERGRLPCGVAPNPFGRQNPVPPSLKPSSSRGALPFFAWYSGDTQPLEPPFSITTALVDIESEPLKALKTGEPFRLRVQADRPVHFVLLMVWADGQVVFQPTQANGFLEAREIALRPPDVANGGFRIADIATGAKQATEYFVLLASLKPLPRPVIVRSRHSRGPMCEAMRRYPIYRFLFEPDAAIEQSSVVRKVIPIPVKSGTAD